MHFSLISHCLLTNNMHSIVSFFDSNSSGWTRQLSANGQYYCSQCKLDQQPQHCSGKVRSIPTPINSHLPISTFHQWNPIQRSLDTLETWLCRHSLDQHFTPRSSSNDPPTQNGHHTPQCPTSRSDIFLHDPSWRGGHPFWLSFSIATTRFHLCSVSWSWIVNVAWIHIGTIL